MKSHAWEEEVAVAFGGEGEGIAVILNFVGFSMAFVFTVLDTTLFDFSISPEELGAVCLSVPATPLSNHFFSGTNGGKLVR